MDDEGNTRSKYEIDPDSRRAHGLYDKAPTPKATSKDTPKATPKAVSKVTPQRAAPQTFESMASKARDAGNSSGDKPYKYTPKVVDYGDEGDRLRARKGDFEDQFKGIGRAGRLYRRDAEAGIKPYKKGGNVKNLKSLFKGKETYGEELKEAKAIKSGKISPQQYAKGEGMEKAKYAKGGGIESRGKTKGTMVRMAMGGSVGSASRRADGIAQRGKTKC